MRERERYPLFDKAGILLRCHPNLFRCLAVIAAAVPPQKRERHIVMVAAAARAACIPCDGCQMR